MKEKLLKYLGYKDKSFWFADENNNPIVFKRSRVELIKEFGLTEDKYVNKLFKVRYFVSVAGKMETPILSDLTLEN